VFLGAAITGGSRPDVAAIFGSQFARSGFGLLAGSLSPGEYQISVFAHSAVTGTFNHAIGVAITVY
jgi:hypothetical protein